MDKDYKWMVFTSCMTYNQSQYIEDTLRGFTMQETTFPVVYCIVDDASTDGEQDVILKSLQENFDEPYRDEETEYARIICAKHKTNTNCVFVVLLLKYNHYSIKKPKREYLSEWVDNAKYCAVCEGDDYWIVSNKLQRQVDFMESHPDYVMCHTDFNLASGGYRNHNIYIAPDDNYFPYSILKGMQVGTLTSLYRISTYQELPHLFIGKGWPMGDYPLWIELSHEGKIKYIPEVTACYRVTPNSASHGSIEKEIRFYEAGVEIKMFYADYYKVNIRPEEIYSRVYTAIIKSAYKHNRSDVAADYFKISKKEHLLNSKLLFFYCATICKPFRWIVHMIYK